jgi:hypothetical protein
MSSDAQYASIFLTSPISFDILFRHLVDIPILQVGRMRQLQNAKRREAKMANAFLFGDVARGPSTGGAAASPYGVSGGMAKGGVDERLGYVMH